MPHDQQLQGAGLIGCSCALPRGSEGVARRGFRALSNGNDPASSWPGETRPRTLEAFCGRLAPLVIRVAIGQFAEVYRNYYPPYLGGTVVAAILPLPSFLPSDRRRNDFLLPQRER
jgi:hypothetical protein